jgi:competence protein ComEA
MTEKDAETDLLGDLIDYPSQKPVFSWQKLLREHPLQVVLGGLGLSLVVVSALFLWRQAQADSRVTIIPAQVGQESEAGKILVHVAGAVEKPGLYQLPVDARINDALAAAGGLSQDANREWFSKTVNLAQKVSDGAKLYVPFAGETGRVEGGANSNLVLGTQEKAVNINTASAAELESLPKIGPATAQKIIAYREEHGGFTSIEELSKVPGIGEKTFEDLRNLISVF